MDISVVIPVKNGQRYLDSVLRAVFSQKIDAGFEVIIIDSGSTDKTLDIVRRYPARCYQIKAEEFNHGLTRNFGISKAQGKYIVLLTQDAMPHDNLWMKKLADNLKRDESIAGVYSRQVCHKESHVLTQIRTSRFLAAQTIRKENQITSRQDYDRLSPREKYFFCNFDNVSSCIRRSVWEKINFPRTEFAEDLEWSKNVLEAGYKIVYEPDSIVYHSHDVSILDWHKRNRVNSRKLAALFGLKSINNVSQFVAYLFLYTYRDAYLLCKYNKSIKIVLSNIHLVPLYSFFGILGAYAGAKNSFRPVCDL